MKEKIKAYKSTKGVRGMKDLKDFLYDWNMLWENNMVSLKEVGNCMIIYDMKFVDDLEHGGRMYCGAFQTLPSDMRKDLKINGNDTIELDYKSCHPRIIASLENYRLEEDFDPYTVLNPETKEAYPRQLMKEVCMACLYSEGKRYAILSIEQKLRKVGVSTSESERMIDAFIETNPYLKNHLYQKDQYKDLQYLDSEMARRIVKVFIDSGIYILSYHDSFRVEEQHEDLLFSAMISAYVDAMEEYMTKHKLPFDRETFFINCVIQ